MVRRCGRGGLASFPHCGSPGFALPSFGARAVAERAFGNSGTAGSPRSRACGPCRALPALPDIGRDLPVLGRPRLPVPWRASRKAAAFRLVLAGVSKPAILPPIYAVKKASTRHFAQGQALCGSRFRPEKSTPFERRS